MVTDPNPELRAELEAALLALEPEIRGLDDLALVSISPELHEQVIYQRDIRLRRQNLLQEAIVALNNAMYALEALEEDGYPGFPPATLPADLYTELQGEESDIDTAVELFGQTSPASTVFVNLGAKASKP